jgi:uncharacterized RDD family membrane protein YckC
MAALGITILKNNVPWGPFTRAQIEDGLARGDFTVKYLAHAPGLKEWLPLGEVLDYVERSEGQRMPPLPPVPGPRELPPVPEPVAIQPESVAPIPAPPPPASRPPILPAAIPHAPEHPSPPPPPIPPSAEKREAKPETRPEVRLTPASFFPRGIAFLIDCAILFGPVVVLFVLGALAIEIPAFIHRVPHESRMEEWALLELNTRRLFWLVLVGFGWFYVAGLESSPSQATVGKRWMGIKVTDAHGERLSFLRATARYAAKYLSALPCLLGFIMALFSSRSLALHDRLTDTRVVDATRFHDTH